jgi:2-polyprenyl-3-methyl-5-hydroxy-6-metoxy-1,4-benzoquinol methylase
MTTSPNCGICSGKLRIRYRGGAPSLVSEAFAPSCHSLSGYGDLYACTQCGTVQQPDLPTGQELRELYRNMRDDAYLTEETGRRRTAGRVIDAIERHRSRGRMLDVGCGHGLLLDEARSRGWRVTGLEISDASRAHAQDALGLDIRAATLDELDPSTDGGFDAIVLSDVLEHLDDPVAALAQIALLLAPGGVACVVTPDPSSPTARLAGSRWWGYLRSHTYLVPRSTLLELLRAAGLEPVEEKQLRRSFTFGCWVGGLGERSGPLARALEGIRRLGIARRQLTLALGDERVVVARR